jgi:hypothetical protein
LGGEGPTAYRIWFADLQGPCKPRRAGVAHRDDAPCQLDGIAGAKAIQVGLNDAVTAIELNHAAH